MSEYRVVTASMVTVNITSNVASFTSEKKLDKSVTVGELKSKLELITGASSGNMQITVYDKNDKFVCRLEDDSATFGSFPVDEGHRLHVEDNSRTKGEFENLDQVEKFELTAAEYSKKESTVQAYLKRNKLGKYNEEEMAALAEEKIKVEEEEKALAETNGMVPGARCEVTVPGQSKRRGTVRFVGNVHFKPGWWIGVEFDEPLGKNDGSVGGQRYFTCQDKYGGFVKPAAVEIGDFPEEDLDLSDGEM